MALVPWAGIGTVEVQKLVACGEGAGEDVDGESVWLMVGMRGWMV